MVRQPDFAGGPFIRGLYVFNFEAEGAQIVGVIRLHFAAIQDLVTVLVKAARPRDYEAIAPLIMCLLSGSIVIAQVSPGSGIARLNRAQAAALLGSESKRGRAQSPLKQGRAGRRLVTS